MNIRVRPGLVAACPARLPPYPHPNFPLCLSKLAGTRGSMRPCPGKFPRAGAEVRVRGRRDIR